MDSILDLTLGSMRLDQAHLLDEIKKKKKEAKRAIDATQSAYQDSVARTRLLNLLLDLMSLSYPNRMK